MAQTKIEWTWRTHPVTGATMPGYTFNSWIGCTQISEACQLCYAKSLDDTRFSKMPAMGGSAEAPQSHFGKGAPRHHTGEQNWRDPYRWDKKAKEAGAALCVFCASLADWADEEVPTEWLVELLHVVRECTSLEWLMLTKRDPLKALERAFDFLHCEMDGAKLTEQQEETRVWLQAWLKGNYPPNVWLGMTMENQKRFDERWPLLRDTPARYRFASIEPLRGSIDLTDAIPFPPGDPRHNPCCKEHDALAIGLDWVIVGGESNGPKKADQIKSHPMHPDDVLNIASQCWAGGIPFYFKQWGDWAPAYEIDHAPQAQAMALTGNVPSLDLGRGEAGRRIAFCFGKTVSGRRLEGRICDDAPPVRLL